MLTIGLTGGIGSGKSTVASRFADLGVPVLSADLIARQVIEPGTDGHREIEAEWGTSLFSNNGQLDRAKVRDVFFKDHSQMKKLEAIIHPKVRAEIRRQLQQLASDGHTYAMVEIPLLIENRLHHLVDQILVVDTAVDQQIARAMRRDGATLDNIERIIARQVDRQTRLEEAHHVVDNAGDLAALDEQTARLHSQFLEIARKMEN